MDMDGSSYRNICEILDEVHVGAVGLPWAEGYPDSFYIHHALDIGWFAPNMAHGVISCMAMT